MSTAIDKRNLVNEIAASAFVPTDFAATRRQALEALKTLQLPGNKTEEYRFTPITRVLEKSFPEWPITKAPGTINDITPYLIPDLDTSVITLVNGKYASGLSRLPSGLTIQPLDDTNPIHAEVLFKEVNFKKDPLAALNTMLWSGGIFIHAKEGKSDRPLLILHIVDGESAPVTAHLRQAIVLEKGAQLSVIEKVVTTGTNARFATLVEEILVKENAALDYCRIQNDNGSIQASHTGIRQLEGSRVNTFTLTLDGQLVRNNLGIVIDGEKCESHFHGLYLLKDDTIGDNHTVVDHQKPDSFSNELYKGIMDGNSKGIFNGKIFVRPHAQKTNAFQSNRNILLTDRATINTKPQLEIWADDVKCSHGCTTGQLDEEALFYLKSRGIHKDTAKAMLLYAFAAETFAVVAHSQLKIHLDSLISERLNKDF